MRDFAALEAFPERLGAGPLELFIASQPTRGLDVGSIEFVHDRIVAERDNGTPVIIVSTELDEVAAFEALTRAGRSPLEAVCELAGVDPAEILGGTR